MVCNRTVSCMAERNDYYEITSLEEKKKIIDDLEIYILFPMLSEARQTKNRMKVSVRSPADAMDG